MLNKARQDDFSKIDKRLSASFGLLIFVLMTIVFWSTIIYFNHVVHKEHDRLGSVIANSIGDSINRVSFSGKYQARLLVEELKSKNANIDSILIQEPSGLVVADSSKKLNGTILTDKFFNNAKKVMQTNSYDIQEVVVNRDGRDVGLVEIDIPYKKGYEDEVFGVTRVFLSTQTLDDSIINGIIYLSVLILFLIVVSYFVVKKMSARIGAPIKNLAYQLQGILKYTPLSIYITNAKGEILSSSPLFDELSDYLDNVDIEWGMERAVFESAEIASYDYTISVDGRISYFHATKYPIAIDANGRVLLVCTVAIDITDRKDAEEKLSELNKNLEKMVDNETYKRLEAEKIALQQSKMAMMGEMIGAIAHQWRQPLNSLGITIQDVYFSYRSNELNEAYVTEFKQEAMRIIQSMSKTIDDFRNFFSPSKIKTEFCIEEAIMETLKIVSAQLANHEIAVYISKETEHRIVGFKGEFQQVILNLISNAKDAIEDSEGENRFINIEIRDDAGDVVVIFEDSGGGIDQEVMDRIFEPYFSTKDQGKGVGIGLYMSQQIIERHMGGVLHVENSNNGAKFTIKLPTAKLS